MDIEHLLKEYEHHREALLFGRYINSDHIRGLLEKHSTHIDLSIIGCSVLNEDIHFIKVGSGPKKILMWSQMHGNESTTTKAIFDLLNVLTQSKNDFVRRLLDSCTLGIIPMLNPDGSRLYTRLNANQVDLNRDAQDLTQPESRVLRNCFEDFQPDFCFNLHGQRTIFSAGERNKPAAVSFLAPAQNNGRSVTKTRKIAMDVIVKMNNNLQSQIPGQVGIYDDAFNINCVGDTFQASNVPTILFEAGHYHEDYNREKVRELIFQSLWVGVVEIVFGNPQGLKEKTYFEIPRNEKLFFDIIIRNAKLKTGEGHQVSDIAIQYDEKLEEDRIVFIPKIDKISDLSDFFGHREIDANEQLVFVEDHTELSEGISIDFVWINNKKQSLSV
ncbi:M14 family metallopeptidase [Gelidibacter maritimus]|uniref:Peptidase M14 n=1 Tax=Gelidibacter maritimus TaxID=2761487 RepID=A0A7W2M6H6_9FLAO|nr:M14 metallopeptidase family protein [Gelidibacter maritimus]MBA6153589.1 peptidase M14 [Gelidibacter maritimus]